MADRWIVGRGDFGCYVEFAPVMMNGDVACAEVQFDSEDEAIRYAIMCDEDLVRPLRANLSDLRRRLRKVARRSGVR